MPQIEPLDIMEIWKERAANEDAALQEGLPSHYIIIRQSFVGYRGINIETGAHFDMPGSANGLELVRKWCKSDGGA